MRFHADLNMVQNHRSLQLRYGQTSLREYTSATAGRHVHRVSPTMRPPLSLDLSCHFGSGSLRRKNPGGLLGPRGSLRRLGGAEPPPDPPKRRADARGAGAAAPL
jgi:hypothetical protein